MKGSGVRVSPSAFTCQHGLGLIPSLALDQSQPDEISEVPGRCRILRSGLDAERVYARRRDGDAGDDGLLVVARGGCVAVDRSDLVAVEHERHDARVGGTDIRDCQVPRPRTDRDPPFDETRLVAIGERAAVGVVPNARTDEYVVPKVRGAWSRHRIDVDQGGINGAAGRTLWAGGPRRTGRAGRTCGAGRPSGPDRSLCARRAR